MRVLIVLAAISLLSTPTVADYYYNGHTYFLTDSRLSWFDAEAEARAWGGHLVTINDYLEQNWLADTFRRPNGCEDACWIGFNDVEQEGTWVWTNGESVLYTNWFGTSEPNDCGGNEDAAVINGHPGGTWNDLPVTRLYYGIIELPWED